MKEGKTIILKQMLKIFEKDKILGCFILLAKQWVKMTALFDICFVILVCHLEIVNFDVLKIIILN